MGAKICGNYRHTANPIISDSTSLTKSKKESLHVVSELESYNQDLVVEHYGRKKSSPLTNDYKILDPPLGKGGFGEVRKAIHKHSGLERAVKVIYKTDMDAEERERLVNEVQILKALVFCFI
jgi:calcium-dependent protein kinase